MKFLQRPQLISGEDPDERKANALKQSLDYIDIFLDKVFNDDDGDDDGDGDDDDENIDGSFDKIEDHNDHHDNQHKNPPVFLLRWGPVDHCRFLHTGQRHATRGDGLSDHIIPVSILSYLIIFFSSHYHHVLSHHILTFCAK